MTVRRLSSHVAIGAVLSLVAAIAAGQGLDLEAARRDKARMAAERERVETIHAERQRACRDRFLVTDCIDDADRDRREALQRLRAREIEIDEATRRARADARRAEIEARRLELAARDASRARGTDRAASAAVGDGPPPRSPALRVPRAVEPPQAAVPKKPPREPKARPAPAATETPAARAAREASSRRRFAERQQEALAERETKRQEAEQRGRSGKPAAAPLPVPPSASR